LVDHFQHEVYEHPEMTPAQRREKWAELRKLYLPDRVDSDTSAVNWFHQGHLFRAPFYYIDYTLAQVCALQFWRRTQVEQDPTAWADYLAICKIGGTKSFLNIVATANLKSPFEEGALAGTVAAAENYLNSIDDLAL
jgi:oligoendopeptidase F